MCVVEIVALLKEAKAQQEKYQPPLRPILSSRIEGLTVQEEDVIGIGVKSGVQRGSSHEGSHGSSLECSVCEDNYVTNLGHSAHGNSLSIQVASSDTV